MVIARQPSVVTLPAARQPYPCIAAYLAQAFPGISRSVWEQRIAAGKVLDDHGTPIGADTPYAPSKRLHYFREVEAEPVIPFAETILFQDDEILVAGKPPFLPVIPGGRFVNECLLQRLRTRTGLTELAPLHRLDRETAGLVLFSVNRQSRGIYHHLFMHGEVTKTYHAISAATVPAGEKQWLVQNRLVRGEPRFRMQAVAGDINARSRIQLLRQQDGRAFFELQPITGKTHQLRVHMSGLGFGILNDRLYPNLQAQQPDDHARPLQLLAKRLEFLDPLRGRRLDFTTDQTLWP